MKFEFLYDQESLEELCKDRDLQTSEIFPPNDFYGQASVLKEYLGLPKWYSLKAVLQHGLEFSDYLWTAEVEAHLPVFFPPSQERSLLYQARTRKPSIPIGFGFLYAMKIFQERHRDLISAASRKGTIVFPSHSTHHIKARFNFEVYAELLEKLPEKFKPIVICIYWRDFLHQHHLEYLKRGFKVVTAGHIYDPLFLYRLYDICRQFLYASSNDLGTHLFASVKSGCNFFFSGMGDVFHENPKELPIPLSDEKVRSRALSLFGVPCDELSMDQIGFVDSLMGTDFLRKRCELRRLVIFSEFCDKLRWNIFGNEGLTRMIPAFFHPGRVFPDFLKKRLNRLRKRTDS